MEEELALNILFHAIAKGYGFYMQALVDAEFMPYLCEQYQPLYTMLKKKIKYIDSQVYTATPSRFRTENIDIFWNILEYAKFIIFLLVSLQIICKHSGDVLLFFC